LDAEHYASSIRNGKVANYLKTGKALGYKFDYASIVKAPALLKEIAKDKAKKEGERCPVCLVSISEFDNDSIEALPCGHVICKDDLATLEASDNPSLRVCPICRGPLH